VSLTVDRPFHVATADHGRKVVAPSRAMTPIPPKPQAQPVGRVPRIARLMALAIKLEGYVRDGLVADRAELSRLGHVTRARITQIMDMNFLAPDIQEAILVLPQTVHGRDPIRERHVRAMFREANWEKQRQMWRQMTPNISEGEVTGCAQYGGYDG
jgi:hypothetical protein